MAEKAAQRETWLVAAWPGMGNVGVGAGAYLVNKLAARLIHEIPPGGVFDLVNIDVKDGLARPGRLPRSMFFHWTNPQGQRDLLIFVGEAQPPIRGYDYCLRLLDVAKEHNVTRLVTFAAMATQLHPTDQPRVFGVGTDDQTIRSLKALEVSLLKEGQITGLNGVLLAAGAERRISGMCLLGELPFFAAGVPNPRASQAVLEVFSTMADISIDFTELRAQAKAVEQALLQLLEKMQEAARQQGQPEELISQGDEETPAEPEPANPPAEKAPALEPAARRRIESLFAAAQKDRGKAVHLKAELDRLGVFSQFEDRFLDLFKKAE
jgi:proteasome assembly chaperone (PAC2) family protein